jgi:CheY-like chemotaxis protein
MPAGAMARHLSHLDAYPGSDLFSALQMYSRITVMDTPALQPILSVEDSDEDYLSLRFALEGLGVANPVERCPNSNLARALLVSEEGCVMAREAAVILLDLNMPGVDGRQLLELFRKIEHDKPVVVFTTSSNQSDIDFCTKAGANDYVVKPLEFDRWQEVVGELIAKWLPSPHPPSPQR